MRTRWVMALMVAGCDLTEKIPLNLPPILLEADPYEGEALTLEEGGVAVYIVVTDEETETLTEAWFLVTDDGTETPLDGEPFSPAYESTGDDYALFAQSFTALSLEPDATLRVVVTDAEAASLTVEWPLVAPE